MGFEVISPPPSAGGGGATDWTELTGKPPLQTTIGDPGSDSNLVTEQAVRELVNNTEGQFFAFAIQAPEAKEYIITRNWGIPVGCTITKITSDADADTSATANFKINSTSITGASAIGVTSSELDTNPSAANVLAQTNQLSVTLSTIVGTGEIRFTVWYTRAN